MIRTISSQTSNEEEFRDWMDIGLLDANLRYSPTLYENIKNNVQFVLLKVVGS